MVGAPLSDRPNVRFAKLGDSPLVFTLGPDVLGVLDSEWRDHRVLTFDPARIRQVPARLARSRAGREPGR